MQNFTFTPNGLTEQGAYYLKYGPTFEPKPQDNIQLIKTKPLVWGAEDYDSMVNSFDL